MNFASAIVNCELWISLAGKSLDTRANSALGKNLSNGIPKAMSRCKRRPASWRRMCDCDIITALPSKDLGESVKSIDDKAIHINLLTDPCAEDLGAGERLPCNR